MYELFTCLGRFGPNHEKCSSTPQGFCYSKTSNAENAVRQASRTNASEREEEDHNFFQIVKSHPNPE
ncbi:hypothetical protein H8356DRAFT_1347897 [Neocallimastix lanati (nom. inval.)]|nr:hypothetical protein H8356DRAFT_1347897 [Neocallimastix sp. JGI-2020a]